MPEHHAKHPEPAAAAAPPGQVFILGEVDHVIEETMPDGTVHSIAVHSQGLVPARTAAAAPAPAQAPKPEATHGKA